MSAPAKLSREDGDPTQRPLGTVDVSELGGVILLGAVSLLAVIFLGIVVVRLSGRPGLTAGAQHD